MAETQYFKSSLLAQQMEDTWTGTVRFNSEQSLSESQKAQARENIGAVPFGSNLKILGHFDTVSELQTSAPRNVGDAYSVGTATPYNLYIFDGLRNEWVDYGQIRAADISARYVENQTISVSAWTEDNTILAGFNYKAQIAISGATEDDFPIVAFDQSDAVSGNFAALSFAFDGYIEVLAKTKPTAAIIIPVATIISNGGNGRGITNATGGITAGSIKTDDLADGSVLRAKLAEEVFVTPIVIVPLDFTIERSYIGKLLRMTQSGDHVINVIRDTTIPAGATFPIFWNFGKSGKIVFGDNTMVYLKGQSNQLNAPTLIIPEQFTLIAIQKIASYEGKDYWLVSGDVEVVT